MTEGRRKMSQVLSRNQRRKINTLINLFGLPIEFFLKKVSLERVLMKLLKKLMWGK